uniref:Superoxide dismutase n=1 Tax=Diabrotica virgifera virgifera TaxID=50390 RepID=A0A6P7GVE8_DIAVI
MLHYVSSVTYISALFFSTIISLAPALKFNGGGHLNHSIFWQNLSPSKSNPSAELCAAINEAFGSLDNMKKQLSAVTTAIQGSGWGWLGYNPNTSKNSIFTIQNIF